MDKIFVFGSNLAGRHGRGAALTARVDYGAQLGIGEGLTGRSYAIPTKDERLQPRPFFHIRDSITKFLIFAKIHPELNFFVTKVGCGLAGFKEEEIGPCFKESPLNCELPLGWERYR